MKLKILALVMSACMLAASSRMAVLASEMDQAAGTMFRLYNPNSGEHFYTGSSEERNQLTEVGWDYEGTAWKAPATSNTPVYRLYNPNAGDHHYTTSAEEKDNLVEVGWEFEGVGWYSDDDLGIPLYRLYNPNAVSGSHHYTASEEERDNLVKVGWKYEGVAWYGESTSNPETPAPTPDPTPVEPEAPKPIAVRVCWCGHTMNIYTYGLSDAEYNAWMAHIDEHLANNESTSYTDIAP